MIFNLRELTDKEVILQTYDIYQYCMYMPTQEKFKEKVGHYLRDHAIKIFACYSHNQIVSMMVVSLTEHDRAEIVGIAVDPSHRKQGIGSYMINQVRTNLNISSFYAETDHDAIEFYRKNGFNITEFSEIYKSETVTRYQCELRFI